MTQNKHQTKSLQLTYDKRVIKSVNQNEIALSADDDKRYIQPNGIHILSWRRPQFFLFPVFDISCRFKIIYIFYFCFLVIVCSYLLYFIVFVCICIILLILSILCYLYNFLWVSRMIVAISKLLFSGLKTKL